MRKPKLALILFAVIAFGLLSAAILAARAEASVSTDKSDYCPGETVAVTGVGFTSGESYAVPVIRPDGSVVLGDGSFSPGWDQVTADENGAFTYQYELDGVEGLYTIKVYGLSWTGDMSETPIASTVFTDAPHGANLQISDLTSEAHWTRTFHWTINKSATPNSWNLFEGDTATSRYTVAVTKDAGTDQSWINGSFTLTNAGDRDTINLDITASAVITGWGGSPIDTGPNTVDLGSDAVIAVDGSASFSFSFEVPVYQTAGVNYHVQISATVDNPKASNPTTAQNPMADPFASGPTLINDQITVSDDNPDSTGPWTFNDSGNETYDVTFAAPADAGTHTNTATIEETGQSDSTSVTVNSYALEVNKTATPSWTRTYSWTINKSADQSSLTLGVGQSFVVHYSVVVGASYNDTYSVSGTITIHNPAPTDAEITDIADVVSTAIGANISDNPDFSYTLAANQTLTVHYTADLPDDSNRTNTATATIQNYAYDSSGTGVASGTTDFTGTADINFTEVTALVDDSVDVTDSFKGSLGTATAGVDAPKTFTYDRTIGPYSTIGDRTIENTATYTTDDTGSTGNDSLSLTVHVIGSAFVGVTSSGFEHIDTFKLIFTPDVPTNPSYYRLTASNPGQFYFNVYYMASGNETFTIDLPYPFVFQITNAVHIYNAAPNGYTPKGEDITFQDNFFEISGAPITLASYGTGKFGTTATITIENNGYTGPIYITIHLDYGLKKVAGHYSKSLIDNRAYNSAFPDILDGADYEFTVSTSFSDSDSISNVNSFKKDPGIGGLVLDSFGTPIQNAKVLIYQGSKLLATVYTDGDGWYMWNYKWTGKAATFTIRLPDYGLRQDSTLKSNGFLVVNFKIA